MSFENSKKNEQHGTNLINWHWLPIQINYFLDVFGEIMTCLAMRADRLTEHVGVDVTMES